MTRIAAIDCGTNTIRLLIADSSERVPGAGTGGLHDVVRRMQFVRLGQGIDATGRIAPDAMQRTLHAAQEYAAQCLRLGVERIRFVATSASRDASNADEFTAGVREAFARWGVSPEVVPGDVEAQLSFRGATGALLAADVAAPYLVVDLGGGSTEFVRGSRSVQAALSTDIGSVRLSERHLSADPPTADQIAAATRDIDAALDRAQDVVGFDQVATLVGLAGTVTTVFAHALELPAYDPQVIDGATLSVSDVLASCAALVRADRQARVAMPFLHEGRVDVIAAGALIWSRVVSRVAQQAGITQVRASEADILDGIAQSVLDRH